MTEQRVTLITGSSTGIGAHLARHYLKAGHHVYGCSRHAPEWTESGYVHIAADVTSEADVVAVMDHIRQSAKRLDNLVNNAGVAAMNHALLTPVSTVKKIMDTNFLGTFLFCREAAKLMQRHQYGRIVNFVSIALPLHLEGEAVYVASKASVLALTQVLSREFAPLGITVNAVGPNPIETDLIRNVPQDKLDALIDRQAIKRLGQMKDVSNVLDFFISEHSSMITGQVVYLGGV